VPLSPDLVQDILEGRRAEAQQLGGFTIPQDWPDPHDARFLRMRLEQMLADPASEDWFAHAIVLRDDPERVMIGHVGYHGPPHEGCVEMGYTIFLAHRGHGYATEAVTGLMDAARAAGVSRFILSIAPGNAPSLAIARKLGFKRTGQHIDEEDGLEYVFERRDR
jgi:RimJ/RimL family protein N-acetyltransferase